MKKYDRDYYRRWYRDPATRIGTAETARRKARLAVSAAEFMLGRPIESVLDVGCGDGLWLAAIKKLRPRMKYLGVDPSEYVVQRLGRRHDVRLGTMGQLGRLKLKKPFDLIVCADVIQYVENEDLRRGLREIRRLSGGVAYIEAFTIEDNMEGDRDGWIDRSERVMRRSFRDAGLSHCGFYCWIDERKITNANRLEMVD
jgi:SAM-dependent methyltransferase